MGCVERMSIDFSDDHAPVWSTGEHNIYRNVDGSFTIRKVTDGVRVTFARFKILADAVIYRNFCEFHEWIRCCKRNKIDYGIYISPLERFYGGPIV